MLWAAVLLALSPAVQALSFAEAYQAAREYDAIYRAAGRERDVSQLNIPIARASLLPFVQLSASDSNVQGSRIFPNGLNQEVRTRLDYSTPQASLQLRMPIFNYEALNSYKQAQLQAEASDETFRAQGMDLIDRLASAYLQVLLSEEAGRLAETLEKSLQTQVAQAQQRQQRGEGTRVQVAQSQAALDVARAKLLEARDQIDLSRRQLTRLTGVPSVAMPGLPSEPEPVRVFPDRLGDWLDLAERQSPTLKARERQVDVTRAGVKRQLAGHLPRLDLVSSLSRSESESTNTIGQQVTQRTIGVQLNVPIFSGGGVDASVRQAELRRMQAEEETRNEREAVAVDVQRHFSAIGVGSKKIAAYRTAVDSTGLALQGAQRSLEMGLGTMTDMADAQNAHYTARRDLAQARIDQLMSYVRLKIRAGAPHSEVTDDLDGLLKTGRLADTPQTPKP